jgi:hypothetical protein
VRHVCVRVCVCVRACVQASGFPCLCAPLLGHRGTRRRRCKYHTTRLVIRRNDDHSALLDARRRAAGRDSRSRTKFLATNGGQRTVHVLGSSTQTTYRAASRRRSSSASRRCHCGTARLGAQRDAHASLQLAHCGPLFGPQRPSENGIACIPRERPQYRVEEPLPVPNFISKPSVLRFSRRARSSASSFARLTSSSCNFFEST